MSKHKPALPERLYYRLADAAQYLGCSADDLLHYGAMAQMVLHTTSSREAVKWLRARRVYNDQFDPFDTFDSEEEKFAPTTYSGPELSTPDRLKFLPARLFCFVPLGLTHCLELELRGKTTLTEASRFVTQTGKAILPGAFIPGLSADDQGVSASFIFEPAEISTDDVYVFAADIGRTSNNLDPHIDEAVPMFNSPSAKSNKLSFLNQASQKFWGNADPDDRTTHPDNDAVAVWLEGKGYSASLAQKAASIIRPDWAAVGRKPEE